MASASDKDLRMIEAVKEELDPLLRRIAKIVKSKVPHGEIRFKSRLAERQFFRLATKILETGNIERYQDAILKVLEEVK